MEALSRRTIGEPSSQSITLSPVSGLFEPEECAPRHDKRVRYHYVNLPALVDDRNRFTPLGQADVSSAGELPKAARLREDARELVGRLRSAVEAHRRGHRPSPRRSGGRSAPIASNAEQSPAGKLDIVRALREQRELTPVVMVGDGINDAPALALADVGIAMGTAGATVASETADAVIMADRTDGVVEAIQIGRRSLAIARQSMIAGIGLSLVAMAFAAAGLITPVAGALLQEAIDVAVIANALRALRR